MVTLLFLISVLALLVATVASDSMQTLKTVSQSGRDTQAKYAAYAGLEKVMNELRKEERYIGETTINRPNHGRHRATMGRLNTVNYEVLIWNNMRTSEERDRGRGDDREPIPAVNGVLVQPDTVYLVSTGQDTSRGEDVVLTSLGGTARRIRPVFEDAAYARSKMVLLGESLVDAWDSEGGWKKYVAGDFPGSAGGGHGNSGGGHGSGWEEPTVEDHEATLGTDSSQGRTMRLIEGSKLNGYFRVGPGATAETAFSDDRGGATSVTAVRGGDSEPAFGIATATSPEFNIAGQENQFDVESYFEIDDKKTEMPRFTAPWDDNDLEPPPRVANPSSTRQERDRHGNNQTVYVPPAPVDLPPGGYTSIDVPEDQTLRLSPGVYYFSEEMKVSGKVVTSGRDPVIVFIGKKAVFNNAEINKDGATSSLQLCFTDQLKDEAELTTLAESLKTYFEMPTTTAIASGDDGGSVIITEPTAATLEEYVKSILAPTVDPTLPADHPDHREGASVLEINGGSVVGSISGKNLVVNANGGEIFGGVMANVVKSQGAKIHQDLALKGSNLMNAGGWALEGLHQLR